MIRRFGHFILYNNSFTLLVLFIVLSAGTVLAANEDVRGAVAGSLVTSEDTLVSVDNSYITSVNLGTFEPTIQIAGIEEDDEFYYVSYTITSIEVMNGVWQGVEKEDILQVSKTHLGERDLGLYVAKELEELVVATVAYLHEVQEIERGIGTNQKVVERTYAGLVGRFLDSSETTFTGYDPVIEEPVVLATVADVPEQVDSAVTEAFSGGNTQTADTANGETPSGNSNASSTESGGIDGSNATSSDTATVPADTATTTDSDVPAAATSTVATTTVVDTLPVDSVAPVIILVGSGEIVLEVDEVYVEEGVTAEDDIDGDVTASVTTAGQVDTAAAGTYIITYEVADTAGNSASITRAIDVVAPVLDEAPVETSETASSTASA